MVWRLAYKRRDKLLLKWLVDHDAPIGWSHSSSSESSESEGAAVEEEDESESEEPISISAVED